MLSRVRRGAGAGFFLDAIAVVVEGAADRIVAADVAAVRVDAGVGFGGWAVVAGVASAVVVAVGLAGVGRGEAVVVGVDDAVAIVVFAGVWASVGGGDA